MTTHIVTIFDKNYLLRALAFRDSLFTYAPNSPVYMLCLDEDTLNTLEKLNLPNTKLFRPEDLDDTELMNSKEGRTLPEFASTAKPAMMSYMLKNGSVAKDDLLAFIDPDILFYSSTEEIFKEIYKGGSITLTPHRFSKKRENEKYTKGTYNAGMVFFRNNPDSILATEEWRKQCIEWCFIRYDNGKIGDQGYLSNWKERYKNVNILNHKGVNLGSWNIENYSIKKSDGSFFIDQDKLICYHFHGLKLYMLGNEIRALPITVHNKCIYNKYLESLNKQNKKLKLVEPVWNFGYIPNPGILKIAKQKILRMAKLWLT